MGYADGVEGATVPVFRRESLLEILAYIDRTLAAEPAVADEPALAFRVIDPDHGRGRHAGELIRVAGELHVHRPFRLWVDLAERLGLRLLTPRAVPPLIELRFERLRAAGPAGARAGIGAAGVTDATDAADVTDPTDATEKYGAGSAFSRISKLEDPGFVLDLAEALARASLPEHPRILDLGVNAGDELALLAVLLGRPAEVTGIDHSASALAIARARFPAARLIEADLGALATLGLGRFDLVISIGTLHSPGIDDRAVLREIVQHHLTPGGAVIVGFPNCRYRAGEVEYGTRMKNFAQPELGLLIKDVAFYRKYLQQHDRQVFVTGKHYVLVTGVRAAGSGSPLNPAGTGSAPG